MVALFYSLICTHDSGIIHTDYALFEGGIILYQDAGLGHMDNPDEDTGKSQQFPTSSEINDTSTCNSGDKYGGLSKVW